MNTDSKKIEKTSELLWAMGILLVAFGVAICSKADLGVSMIAAPAFIVHEFLASMWNGISVGVVEYMIQGALLVILCIVVRKFNWRYLLAFAVAVLYGYALNLFIFILEGVQPTTVVVRWLLLILGDAIIAIGVACFFRTYMPLQVFQLFVAVLTERFGLTMSKVKQIFDISLLAVSITLALVLFRDVTEFDFSAIWHTSYHSIGLGTIFTTAVNSPFIALGGKLIDRIFSPSPAFPKLKALLERK